MRTITQYKFEHQIRQTNLTSVIKMDNAVDLLQDMFNLDKPLRDLGDFANAIYLTSNNPLVNMGNLVQHLTSSTQQFKGLSVKIQSLHGKYDVLLV